MISAQSHGREHQLKLSPEKEEAPAALARSEADTAKTNQTGVSTTDAVTVKANIPTAGTVKRAVFDSLSRGERLTSNDALFRFGTSRLAAIVHRLQREGWSIEAQIIEATTASGRVAHVARYEMKEAA